MRDYPFTVRPLAKEEGNGYLIEFPDLPGCISDGETPEDAIRNGQDALKGYLLTLKEFGKPALRPGTTSGASGQWRQQFPKSLHARLTARAKAEGVSVNTLVTAMIAEGLGKREHQRGAIDSPSAPLWQPSISHPVALAAATGLLPGCMARRLNTASRYSNAST